MQNILTSQHNGPAKSHFSLFLTEDKTIVFDSAPVNLIFTIQQVQWKIPGVQTLHLVQLLLAHQADPTHK